jgi:predicted dehydrogenase
MKTAKNSSRRRFLQGSVAGVGGAISLGYRQSTWAQASGSNEAIQVAIIGLGGKGGGHLNEIAGLHESNRGARVAAICDPDQSVIDRRLGDLAKKQIKPKAYADYRELCLDDSIDAVIIATPNHTHTVIAMTAIAAGKHVYVEKPVSHNIHEGRALAEAALKRPNLIVQHGLQRRSDSGWVDVMEWIKDEPLGEMTLSRGLNFKPRQSIGKLAGPIDPPKSVNYDLWCGPREMAPLHREKFHYDWHWQWAYGNGDIGNQGPHQLDVARWAINQMVLPKRTMSFGNRWGYDDDGETANNQLAFFDYDPVPLIFDNRGLPARGMDWRLMPVYQVNGKVAAPRIGNVIHFEGGFVQESRAYDNEGKAIDREIKIRDGGPHVSLFLSDIRAGKQTDENRSALNGHLSSALAHIANISYRLGQQVDPNEVRERLQGDVVAQETVENFMVNLEMNGIDAGEDRAIVGPWLEIDPSTERFVGEFADEANALDASHYREGFELPKII